MPDCLPGCEMIAGVVCSPPSSVSYTSGRWRGSECTAISSGSLSVRMNVTYGEGNPRCRPGALPVWQ